MSKWSKLKVAVLTAGLTLPALLLEGCGLIPEMDRLVKLVTIGNLFD